MEATRSMSSMESSRSSMDSLPRSPTSPGPNISMASPGKILKNEDFKKTEKLSDLNQELSEYIGLVQKLEMTAENGMASTRTTINVNIDRTSISVNLEGFRSTITALQDDCGKNDRRIAELLAEIFRLECEIKKLLNSNNKQSDIGGLDLAIAQLEAEVARLKASLAFHQGQEKIFIGQKEALEKEIANLTNSLDTGSKALTNKRQENARLGCEVAKQEKELRFQVSMKTKEVTAERTKTNINWEDFKAKKGDQYRIWLDEQLQELQATYQQQQQDVRVTMRDMYKEKKEKLEIELKKATANVDKPDGEASRLKIELERMRMQLTELEASQQNLRIKNVEITAEQKMKEALYKEQLSAKEKELERKRKEHDEIKAEEEELKALRNQEQVELYSNTLTPEMRRIAGRLGTQQVINNGKTLNFSRKTVEATITNGTTVSSSPLLAAAPRVSLPPPMASRSD